MTSERSLDELAPFANRITPVYDRDYDPNDRLLSHTQNVASLTASLASMTKIRVVKALAGNGAGTKTEVNAAVERAVAANSEFYCAAAWALRHWSR